MNPGEAEATFFGFLLALAAAQYGVDEDPLGFFFVDVARRIDDEHPVRQVDLICRQPDPFVLVHQLEHFVDPAAQLGVNPLKGLGNVPQRGVRKMNNFERHRRT